MDRWQQPYRLFYFSWNYNERKIFCKGNLVIFRYALNCLKVESLSCRKKRLMIQTYKSFTSNKEKTNKIQLYTDVL